MTKFNETLKEKLSRAIGIPLVMLGIDPRKILNIRYLPKFFKDYSNFKKAGGTITHYFPVLKEYGDQAGVSGGHYFHQDLLVASFIHTKNPTRHIDIGSRFDGFVAHVAAFRKIEVLDIRELESTGHENIKFTCADFMNDSSIAEASADSVSCLHAIEHFGLGRYGDPLDPKGHIKGFNQLLRILTNNGHLYISFPIGVENEVHFNAHRVFHPKEVLSWTNNADKIELIRFDYVDDEGDLHKNFPLNDKCPIVKYGCGIYTFRKLS